MSCYRAPQNNVYINVIEKTVSNYSKYQTIG